MKIRQGKDILLRWKVLTNGQELSLEGRNITLVMTTPVGREKALEYGVEGRMVVARLLGTTLTHLGDYTITLWENRGEEGQTAVDAVNAFELVKYSTMEDGNPSYGNLEAEVLSLSGDLGVLQQGTTTEKNEQVDKNTADIADIKQGMGEVQEEIDSLKNKDAEQDEKIATKQPLLTGDEFKTINGESIMGEGNIEIQGGAGGGITPEEKAEMQAELAEKIESSPTEAVIEEIEPSVVSDALRKSPQTLTEAEQTQARANIKAQKELSLTVKDNGNIVLSNLDGQTKEFMPATPSGDPMHWAYVSTGAEYNATTSFIVVNNVPWENLVDPIAYKAQWNLDIVADNLVQSDSITYNGISYRYAKDTRTSPTDGTQPRYRIVVKDDTTGKWVWDDTKVLHLPNRWYLNGLGDITNGEMREIYRIEKKDMSSGVYMLYWQQNTLRTATVRQGSYGAQSSGYSVSQNTTIEVVNFDTLATFDNEVVGSVNIRHIISNANRLTLEYITKTISKGTFSTKNLVTCNLRNLKKSISMDNSPNLSRATIKRLISKAIPTSAITITLHADAYARLANDQEVIDALNTKNSALSASGGSISLVSA